MKIGEIKQETKKDDSPNKIIGLTEANKIEQETNGLRSPNIISSSKEKIIIAITSSLIGLMFGYLMKDKIDKVRIDTHGITLEKIELKK